MSSPSGSKKLKPPTAKEGTPFRAGCEDTIPRTFKNDGPPSEEKNGNPESSKEDTVPARMNATHCPAINVCSAFDSCQHNNKCVNITIDICNTNNPSFKVQVTTSASRVIEGLNTPSY